ncbi:hypothetical protein NN4_85720 [Nocardia ninae NBRC 108245]|uniref:Uncharacterized protein n=1 Tax=Nocardia ninae NBRC 108245 TaxID=1210091 RepID=A0A511MTX9_9NOCA|nr:hypothetical protein NN4_85720 [Nocardia ninae NBRC 108245]
MDSLATGSAALPAPLRTVLEALAKEVGPVLAKGLIQLITSNNPPSPKGRPAAPAPAADDYAEDADSDVVDNSDAVDDAEETGDSDAGDGSEETSVGIYSGAAGDSGDAETAEATDDADVAGYADDTEITGYSEGADGAGYAEDGDDTGYTEDGDDTSVADYADVVDAADADADWKPLALEPSPVG